MSTSQRIISALRQSLTHHHHRPSLTLTPVGSGTSAGPSNLKLVPVRPFSRSLARSDASSSPSPSDGSPSGSNGSDGPVTLTLEKSLRDALKAAMKAKDRAAMTTYKAALADITNATKTGNVSDDPEVQERAMMNALLKSIKTRREAAEQYAPSSPSAHPENHANLLQEISLLSSHLPSTPTLEAVTEKVQAIIDGLSEEMRASKSVQGLIMKTLWADLGEQGKALDRKEVGKMVSEMVRKITGSGK